ncbi:hypothetical protein OTU49_016657 [Cherax quadricarinatus]|uniref:Sulfotransferase domain-containing protein n=3 Tax=Cherax quadricarinatus TaxID=27406 RepID=A0AAW0Y690_CHEQU|nr:WSCD family member AGAP003962-like [Cherax quadricarinatus]
MNVTVTDVWSPRADKSSDGRVNWSQVLLAPQVDYSRKARKLWPLDPQCSWVEVRFGLRLKKTWLLSFPRSGNSWTRYLLEAATGFFTSSIYNSTHLKYLGYLGEAEPPLRGTTLVIKTHSVGPLAHFPQFPVIALVRSPARAIISYWNYMSVEEAWRRFKGSVSRSSYRTAAFHKFVREKLENWKSIYVTVLRNTSRLHLVYYEHLREDPLKELRAILAFLGVRTSEARLACLARHLDGVAKGGQREVYPYTAWERAMFQRALAQLDVLFRLRGFPPLPDYRRYKS